MHVVKKVILNFVAGISRVLPASFKKILYGLGPITESIREILNRAAPIGLTEAEISAGALAGMNMRLDLQTEKDYWLGIYETDLQAAICDLVEPGWVAYDVGANIGYISLMLARLVGSTGKIFAFEALPSNIERLRENVSLNDFNSRVQVIHGAVGSTSAPVKFMVGPSGTMGKTEGSAGRTEGHVESIDVPGYTLDDFVYRDGNPSPQIIKIDIEGGEVLALPGMKRLLAEVRPLIFLELHGPEAARVAWETLRAAGYNIARMKRGYSTVPTLDALDWKSYLIALP